MMAAAPPIAHRRETDEVATLIDLLHEVVQGALRELHPMLAKEGITMGQFWAIHTVSSLEAASVNTVARYLGVSAPTLCGSLDMLEDAGLVRRQRSERDRRAVELSLTPRGRRVEARVWREMARVMNEASGEIPEADVATAVRVFREVARRLTENGGPAHKGAA